MKTRTGMVLALLALASFAAPPPTAAHEFDAGYYYATGKIEPLGFSIYMEGTHRLTNGSGATISLLSSYYYDLDAYAGKQVKVSGWTEHTVEGSSVHMYVSYLTVLTPKTPVPFTVFDQDKGNDGYDDDDVAKRFVSVRDAKVFEVFHALLHPGLKLPAVDFKKHQVLGAFQGPKFSPGHSITIAAVEKSGTRLDVTTTQTAPPPMGMMMILKDPVHPHSLAKTLKTTGSVYFDGKKGKVLAMSDLKAPGSLVTIGQWGFNGTVDTSKVKVGVFNMAINAKYFQWPGNHPTGVKSVTGDFSFTIKPVDDTVNSYRRYYVIVWEDKNGDDSPVGEPQASSDPLRWMGGETWANGDGAVLPTVPHLTFTLEGAL